MVDQKHTPEQHVEKFWEGVAKKGADECWEWQKGRFKSGYGAIRWYDRVRTTHTVSWELHNGPIPEGKCICHKCDNRKCVNPEHLFLGTVGDNNRDMFAKKRWAPVKPRDGEHNSNAKLSRAQVDEIRKRSLAGETTMQLAVAFGIGEGAMLRAIRGKTYAAASRRRPTETS